MKVTVIDAVMGAGNTYWIKGLQGQIPFDRHATNRRRGESARRPGATCYDRSQHGSLAQLLDRSAQHSSLSGVLG